MNRKWGPDAREFAGWSDRIERILRRGLWILIVLLLLFQTALQVPAIRSWLSVTSRLEGFRYERISGLSSPGLFASP